MKKTVLCLFLSVFVVLQNFCFNAHCIEMPVNSAKRCALVEMSTGRLICGKRAYDKASMASTTKIMTAVLLLENADLDTEIVCTKEMVMVEGSSMGLLVGDRVHFYDLLYGMMLSSGNDAANATAIAIAGSTEKFADMMNEKAQEVGMKDTHFVTPSGLDDVEHYSTAYDMALLACYAMKNEQFAQAVASKSAKLNYGNPPYDRTLTNHNKLLSYYDQCCGVKTGFTKKSGRCLVSCAKNETGGVVCVTLNDPNDWSDHENLLETGLNCLETQKQPAEKITVDVINSDDDILAISEGVDVCVLPGDKITKEVVFDDVQLAPVNRGDIVGTVSYYINGKEVAKSNLVAQYNVSATNQNKDFLYWVKKLISG